MKNELIKISQNLTQEEFEELYKNSAFYKIIPLFLASYASHHSRASYARSLREFFFFWYQQGIIFFDFNELQRSHVDGFQRSMEAAQCLSPASVCAKVSAVVSLCRFMFENEWIKKNPAAFVKLPKISKLKGKTQALSEQEIFFLLKTLEQEKKLALKPQVKKEDYKAWLQYGIFLTMATVGMRCSELCKLKIKDFRKSGGDFYRLHLSLKGGEEHAPLIPHYLSAFLLEYIRICKSFSSINDPLFALTPRSKNEIKREYLSKIVTLVAKKNGIDKKISAHSLRATVASMLHKNKIPVGEIKDLLGHKSILTTMMYVRKTDEENESAALKNPLGQKLGNT